MQPDSRPNARPITQPNTRPANDGSALSIRPAVEPEVGARPDSSLGDLFSRLSSETSTLVAQEIRLAKGELRESGAHLLHGATRVAVAAVVALAGMLALTAFLVLGLGALFGNYWLAALIVGVALTAAGGLWARAAAGDMRRRGLAPDETVRTLREDAEWAKQEGRAVKRELTR